MIDSLNNTFENINGWLKYSEAKNGVLLTLTSGFIGSVISIYGFPAQLSESFVDNLKVIYHWELIIALSISLVLLLISFLPQTNNRVFWFSSLEKRDDDNLLFYGDIQKYSVKEYLNKLNDGKENQYSNNEFFYANQIIINSRITYRKLQYFKVALLFVLAGLITLVGAVIVLIFFSPNND